MSLSVDPPGCSVQASGGNSVHQLTNGGTERLVFKVKSSNNEQYRIRPVFGFVEPGATISLEITRLSGEPKEDKLVIPFAVAAADATDAKTAFDAATPAGSITIPLTAT